jgi:FkbH-like protein
VAAALARAEWQPTVFAAEPSRLDILSLSPSWPLEPLRIAVHRNSGVELFTVPLARFLAYAGYAAEFAIGDYDDSLVFGGNAGEAGGAAAELVWLDTMRYAMPPSELAVWLAGRLRARRARVGWPMLVGLLPTEIAGASHRGDAPGAQGAAHPDDLDRLLIDRLADLAGVSVMPVAELARNVGAGFFDPRTASVTASPLSNRGAIEVARRLAFVWLMPALQPRIKAVAVDLDGTICRGVLGEDGPAALSIEPAHVAIQTALRDLGRAGVMLVLVSKNDAEDVDRLFDARSDFPLGIADFAVRAAGWGEKATSIAGAAEKLRIDPSTFLLLDDNIGEVAAAAAAIPGLRTLLAGDAVETARALGLFPGLVGYRTGEADAVRLPDLLAADERARLVETAVDSVSYLRSLDVRLTFASDPTSHRDRLHELSMKTNQFNTALARYSEVEVDRRIAAPDCRTISVALADRLSESGIIAAVQTHREDDTVVVDEIAISCRALGRGLEDAIVGEAIVKAAEELGAARARIQVVEGPRNEPARAYVGALLAETGGDEAATLVLLAARVDRLREAVSIEWPAPPR